MARLAAVLVAAGLVASAPVNGQSRDVLPIQPPPFDGVIAPHIEDSRPGTPFRVQPPAGAPNLLLFMADDAGFAMPSAFGGPVPTPAMDRLAARGQRYNRFHTTGICSPTRAALLTGRNHHNTGTGYLADLPAAYPGYGGRIIPETASLAQVLRLNGYSTAMFGKHHNVPTGERSRAGPFNAWPTGLGFEYFFGFVAGDTDQFQPSLFRDTQQVLGNEGSADLLEKRLADDLIRWLHNQQAGAPNKPFMAYLAPGSPHAPQQAPAEWIAKFHGKFDQGWDKVREQIFARQLEQGIVPAGTKLTPRPEQVPAWDTLDPARKRFAARSMEVAAAALAYQDEQLGRVLAELERMGLAENTLVVVVQGDNGASAEAGPEGTVNELRSMGTHDESSDWLTEHAEHLGGPMTYGNYQAGWAWAMNTPLRWTKQFGSMLGGIRNGTIVSWPGRVAKPGSVCAEFTHVIDVAPTVLDAAGLPAPSSVLGTAQRPLDGRSLLPSLAECQPDRARTQYFEIGGKVGLYADGWFLSGDDGRLPWETLPPEGTRPAISWSLYDLSQDFSQSIDLSGEEPMRLATLKALWDSEARRNSVYPLDHRFATARSGRRGTGAATGSGAGRTFRLWGKDVSLPTSSEPILIARSFTVDADLELARDRASGVVLALGSRFGGWSLFLDRGRPSFVFARSTDPTEIWKVTSTEALPRGTQKLQLRFAATGPGKPATVTILSGGSELARLELPINFLMPAGGGETLDVGRDLGVPVVNYRFAQGAIEGDIPLVTIRYD